MSRSLKESLAAMAASLVILLFIHYVLDTKTTCVQSIMLYFLLRIDLRVQEVFG